MKNRDGWIFEVYERIRPIVLGVMLGFAINIIIAYVTTVNQSQRAVSDFSLLIAIVAIVIVVLALFFNRQDMNGQSE